MSLSRRTLLSTALAAPALGFLPTSAHAASPPGDVVGKITVGYQGWFACRGDNSPIDGWWHWNDNWSQPPAPPTSSIVAWPDVRDYARTYPTAFADLGDGRPATLFSNHDR